MEGNKRIMVYEDEMHGMRSGESLSLFNLIMN